jgi:arylsulfatase
LVALLALFWLLPGCGPAGHQGSCRQTHDLIVELPEAIPASDTGVMDLGLAESRQFLDEGWSWDATAGDGSSFVWGTGDRSVLEFELRRPRPVRVRLRCLPYHLEHRPPQSLIPSVNRRALAALTLEPRWAEYEFELPVSAVRAGRNLLAFDYGYSASPAATEGTADRRRLAVAWDWIDFGGTAGGEAVAVPERGLLHLSAGSQLDYYLDLHPGSVLSVERVLTASPACGRWVVSLTPDQGAERLIAELSGNSGPLRLPLGPTVGLARLRLRVATEASDLRCVTLRRPTIQAPEAPSASRVAIGAATPDTRGPVPIIVYLVDTLRADRLGSYGNRRSLTPNLDRFAADGVVFEDAIAQSPWTLASVASIFTGVWPGAHGVTQNDSRLPADLPTLTSLLQQEGYVSAVVVANGWISRRRGFADHVDRFVMVDLKAPRTRAVHQASFTWLDSLDAGRPFFLYAHTIEPHPPYRPMPQHARRLAVRVDDPRIGSTKLLVDMKQGRQSCTDALVQAHRDLYDAEVVGMDEAFGRFVDGLKQRELYDDALILFVSDHGEEFMEHGSWTHGHSLHAELLQVPLIMKLPGGQWAGTRVREPVQHVDLLPTILDVVGVAAAATGSGSSLLPRLKADKRGTGLEAGVRFTPIYSSKRDRGVSVVAGSWKLIAPRANPLSLQVRLYNRAADPGEHHDLAPERPIVAGYLGALLRRQLRLTREPRTSEPVVMDADTQRQLKALGYLN